MAEPRSSAHHLGFIPVCLLILFTTIRALEGGLVWGMQSGIPVMDGCRAFCCLGAPTIPLVHLHSLYVLLI
jgi:hypothetical protein